MGDQSLRPEFGPDWPGRKLIDEARRQADAARAFPPSMPEMVAGYRILNELGRGGMGVVYEAVKEGLEDRRVALKMLHPGSLSGSARGRLEYEAKLLSRLDHPNIARIYDSGIAATPVGDQPFFVMELVDGCDLKTFVDGLPHRAVLEILAQVCDAIHHAHLNGVIHRDLKPANILIDKGGDLKIVDFGVARTTTPTDLTRASWDSAGHVGTLAYMSPEQLKEEPEKLDHRSDVYSLGVTAFGLLAGRPPYELPRFPSFRAEQIICETEPDRLGAIDPRLRGEVEAIVSKALEKRKDRRYSSAAEFGADIRRFLSHEPVRARVHGPAFRVLKFSLRNRGLVAGAALIAAALLIATLSTTALMINGLAEQRRAKLTASTLGLLAEMRDYDPGDSPEAIAEHVTSATTDPTKAAFVLERVGSNMRIQMPSHTVILWRASLEQRLLAAERSRSPANLAAVMRAYNLLGDYYVRLHWTEDALRLSTEALDWCAEQGLVPTHEDHLRARVNRIDALFEAGRHIDARDAAEILYRDRTSLHRSHPDRGEILHLYAMVLRTAPDRTRGDLELARATLEEAVQLHKFYQGMSNGATQAAMVELADTLIDLAAADCDAPSHADSMGRARRLVLETAHCPTAYFSDEGLLVLARLHIFRTRREFVDGPSSLWPEVAIALTEEWEPSGWHVGYAAYRYGLYLERAGESEHAVAHYRLAIDKIADAPYAWMLENATSAILRVQNQRGLGDRRDTESGVGTTPPPW